MLIKTQLRTIGSRHWRSFLKDEYRRLMVLCVGTVGAAILLLSVALLHSGPRVRLIEVDTTARLTHGSSLKIVFDRPLDTRDYTSAISFEPTVDFEVKQQGKLLIVGLKNNLRQSQTYMITIQPEVYDANGKKMKSRYSHTFTTSAAKYAYLQRNYEVRVYDGKDADDIVYLESLDGKSERLFSAPRIRMFRANDRYAVIAVDEAESDALYTVDVKTRKIRKEKLFINGTIRELAMSPQGSFALYTIEPDFNADDPAAFEKYAYQLHALDAEKGEEFLLTDASQEPLKAESVVLNNDGQYALVKDLSGAFLVVSPYNDNDPVLIGAHTRSYGFDAASEHIIFEDEGEISTYRIVDALKEVRPDNAIVTSVSATKGGIFTFIADYEDGSFVSKLQKRDQWDVDPATLWESKNQQDIINTFSESYDERYVAIQKIPSDCQYDDYETSSECRESGIVVYDTQEKHDVTFLNGIGFLWLP